MGVEEIRTYLSHLVIDKKVAASTQNFNLLRLYKAQSKIDFKKVCGMQSYIEDTG